ncbi:MAG: hypothetical protein HKO89_02180 [Saprospiraceae bacterium]|nr:hypothetical protein [Saprospiraceae bacterium]
MKDIFRSYKIGWLCFLYNWRFILFIFIVNLVLAYIAVGPLSMAMEDAFGNNGQLEQLIGSFDYVIVSDFLRLYRLNVTTVMKHIIPLSVVYLIFYCFIYGGLTDVAVNGLKRLNFSRIFGSCARYFWKMIWLAILVFVIFGIVFFLLFRFFAIEGFNPFELETETGILNRFWISLVFLSIASFLLTTFRDFSKISIVQEDKHQFVPAIKTGFHSALKPMNLMLSFLNVLVLVIALILYHVFKIRIGEFNIAVIIIGQLLVFFRIAYKLIRLASFNAIQSANTDV